MAARSRKRILKTENKLLEFDKIQLRDIICSICQSILIEPVTLPCYHNFCQCCFKSSVENNALCCPLCRLRIGSWLRTATKHNKIVDTKLWEFIKSKFSCEVNTKLLGEDLNLSQGQVTVCVSNPGEIRAEYEAELKRLQAERLELEQKQFQETAILIDKIQKEEDETHKQYLSRIKKDEMLAWQVQHEQKKSSATMGRLRQPVSKLRLKSSKMDDFLTKKIPHSHKTHIPSLTDDSTNSTASSDSVISQTKPENRGSPEMVPSFSRFLRNKLEKKERNTSGLWNKENGDNCQTKKTDLLSHLNNALTTDRNDLDKVQNSTQSLPVSLPYTGILQHKMNILDKRSVGSGSVDSMKQELCYFKPVQGTTVTCYNAKRGLPIKVPVMRLEKSVTLVPKDPPAAMQYVEGLCLLRNRSLAQNLPSAFVIALNKVFPTDSQSLVNSEMNHNTTQNATPIVTRNTLTKTKNSTIVDGITKLNEETPLRRTRSMGSITKDENETTPKKAKTKLRQVSSERKPYLRSESKKMSAKKLLNSPRIHPDCVNNNKVNLAVKNLSSPLRDCDVTTIFEEQLRIVSRMEQEKSDFELARKMEAEANGRRLLRPPTKRRVPLPCSLRSAKKLKA